MTVAFASNFVTPFLFARRNHVLEFVSSDRTCDPLLETGPPTGTASSEKSDLVTLSHQPGTCTDQVNVVLPPIPTVVGLATRVPVTSSFKQSFGSGSKALADSVSADDTAKVHATRKAER